MASLDLAEIARKAHACSSSPSGANAALVEAQLNN